MRKLGGPNSSSPKLPPEIANEQKPKVRHSLVYTDAYVKPWIPLLKIALYRTAVIIYAKVYDIEQKRYKECQAAIIDPDKTKHTQILNEVFDS